MLCFVPSVKDTNFSALITSPATTDDDDQALLERLAKREERRQRRMREALERQKESDPTISDGQVTVTQTTEDRPGHKSHLTDAEEETTENFITTTENKDCRENEVEREEKETSTANKVQEEEPKQESVGKPEEKSHGSYFTEEVHFINNLVLYFNKMLLLSFSWHRLVTG